MKNPAKLIGGGIRAVTDINKMWDLAGNHKWSEAKGRLKSSADNLSIRIPSPEAEFDLNLAYLQIEILGGTCEHVVEAIQICSKQLDEGKVRYKEEVCLYLNEYFQQLIDLSCQDCGVVISKSLTSQTDQLELTRSWSGVPEFIKARFPL